MKWDMRRPCSTCPFLKKGGIRLHPSRAIEITSMMESMDGSTFACHETAFSRDDCDEGEILITGNSKHCAGAIIYALKHDNMTQMMRISHRLGMWNPGEFRDHEKVIDSAKEMMDEQ